LNNLILNKVGGKLEINIIGSIGDSMFSEGYTKEQAKKDILENRDKELIVNIFSPGGNFYDGVWIYELLKSHPMPTTSNILSLAASAASVIALGCKKVRMSKNATLMIHEPAMNTKLTSTNASKLKSQMDIAYSQLINIYQSKTGLNEDKLRELMDNKDCWMDSTQAKEMGFVDEVFDSEKVLASLMNDVTSGFSIEDSIKNKDFDMENEIKYTELENSYSNLLAEYDTMKLEISTLKTENEANTLVKAELEEKVNTLETEKTELVNNKVELENKVNELVNAQIEDFINNSVVTGKITEVQKENYLKLAKTDFESVKNIINSIPNRTKISDIITNSTQVNGLDELIKGKENWDEIDYLKKDNSTLETIKSMYPEYYSKIHKKAYPMS
jgi:ATP-dependent protease ClpP protease subunit